MFVLCFSSNATSRSDLKIVAIIKGIKEIKTVSGLLKITETIFGN